MRIRPYLHRKDYPYLAKWTEDERVHAMWCAGLVSCPLTEESLLEFLEKEAAEWTGSAYVATEKDGRPIGFFVYSVNTEENSGFLKFIVLDSELRGRGYGGQMLELALQYAFTITGVSSVQLNVFDCNERARKCYTRLGFREDGVVRDAFCYKNESWDKYHMTVWITPAPFENADNPSCCSSCRPR